MFSFLGQTQGGLPEVYRGVLRARGVVMVAEYQELRP